MFDDSWTKDLSDLRMLVPMARCHPELRLKAGHRLNEEEKSGDEERIQNDGPAWLPRSSPPRCARWDGTKDTGILHQANTNTVTEAEKQATNNSGSREQQQQRQQ